MIKVLLDAAAAGTTEGQQGPSTLIMLAIFAVFIIFWYVIAIRPQRKKEKELKSKVDTMRVGDRIITIGGLCGQVANIKDDEVTIMTSAANTLVTFKKSAINNVISRDAKPNEAAPAKEEKKASKDEAKAEKVEAEASSDENTTAEE
ncbi:MAG: preprotein translocase subunit YajC [Clostridiales bacterium]|nr:preprotein translocase subunit YajC [Clostridiales bacterium]